MLAIVVAKLPSCEAVQIQRVSRCAALCPSCSVCTSFLCVQSLTRLTVACATPGVWSPSCESVSRAVAGTSGALLLPAGNCRLVWLSSC